MQVRDAWGEGLHIVIAGLTNTYASYITTVSGAVAQCWVGATALMTAGEIQGLAGFPGVSCCDHQGWLSRIVHACKDSLWDIFVAAPSSKGRPQVPTSPCSFYVPCRTLLSHPAV